MEVKTKAKWQRRTDGLAAFAIAWFGWGLELQISLLFGAKNPYLTKCTYQMAL